MKKIYVRPLFEVVSMGKIDIVTASRGIEEGTDESQRSYSMDAKRRNGIWDEE